MLYILHAIYSDGLDIYEALKGFKLYPSKMHNMKTPYKKELSVHPKVKDIVDKYSAMYEGQARIIVRPSGTEHVLRISVEAQNEDLVIKLIETIVSEIEDVEKSLRG